MSLYRYRAATSEGQIIEESTDAPSFEALNNIIINRKLTLLNAEEETAESLSKNIASGKKELTKQDLAIFSRQLASLLKAGVPLKESIDSLLSYAKPNQKKLLLSISQDVQRGDSLSDSLKKHPRTFNQVYIATIAAAEKVGALEKALFQLSEMLLWERHIQKNIKKALQYPAALVFVMTIAIIVLQQIVVPQFSNIFQKLGGKLPIATKLLIISSNVISNYWWLLLAAILFTAWLVKKSLANETGRKRFDNMILKIPLFGSILQNLFLARFARMLGLLYSNGLPLPDALKTLEKTIGNLHISREISSIQEAVSDGQSLGEAISSQKSFSPMIKNMLKTGEQSGEISQAMHTVCEFYDEETNQAIDSLTQWIEPVLTLVLGAFVLFLAVAIFLPWWDLTGLYNK